MAQSLIRENIGKCRREADCRLIARDATRLAANTEAPFSLVFLDPPYGKGLGETCLKRLIDGAWVSEDALAVFEVGAEETPETPGWNTVATKEYGAAKVLFLTRSTAN